MRLVTRFVVLVVVLGGGLAAQAGLRRYLEAPGPLPVVPLQRPLSEFPLELGEWRGVDRAITDERLLYADEHLQRVYYNPRQQAVRVWMVYSHESLDRRHHPEVCMAVAGQPEDRGAREPLALPGHAAPVQEFRYGRPGDYQLVYYWYYTLSPPPDESVSGLQRLYQHLRSRPGSVTIEVFAPEQSAADAEAARELVRLLDAAVQTHVGPTAVRGSHRVTVSVIQQPPEK